MASDLSPNDHRSISENYGLHDLYSDANHADREHIEKKLSSLESTAATILRPLVDAAKASPPPPVALKRRDLNTLRKFLFIMGHRHRSRANQFANSLFDPQTGADIKKHILDHMGNKRATSRDVWLQNLREILDANVWDIPDNPRIFIHDRRDYATAMRGFRMVFWQAPGNEEFIMCDTGFGFVDGFHYQIDPGILEKHLSLPLLSPHRGRLDPSAAGPSGFETTQGTITWIRAYPVSSHLVLVLVNKALSDSDRSWALEELLEMGPPSRYFDFPFPKPLDTKYENLSKAGRLALETGDMITLTGGVEARADIIASMMQGHPAPPMLFDGNVLESREHDIFRFPITTLNSKQVALVNGLVLENANQITFRAPENLYRYICAYENEPVWDADRDYQALKAALQGQSAVGSMTAGLSDIENAKINVVSHHSARAAKIDFDTRKNFRPRVPTFMLRNFGLLDGSERKRDFGNDDHTPCSPSSLEPTAETQGRKLSIYQMATHELEMNITVDGESCGLMNADDDTERLWQTGLEKKLLGLQVAAEAILDLLTEAAEQYRDTTIRLSQSGLNVLGKFLFLLGYRNPWLTFGEGTNLCWGNLFDSQTRTELHMNFKKRKPAGLSTWLRNLNGILDLDTWKIPGSADVYLDDRIEFARDMRRRRLVFWRAAENEEFVLSDTRFGFSDGVSYGTEASVATMLDLPFYVPGMPLVSQSGRINGCFQTWFRIFPVSPSLAVVLVDRIFADEEHGEAKEYLLDKGPPSRFLDFPFPKPRVSYSGADEGSFGAENTEAAMAHQLRFATKAATKTAEKRVARGTVPPPRVGGKIRESREQDQYEFTIAQLTVEQTYVVNGLVVKNAEDRLIFCAPERLLRYVEAYEKVRTSTDKRDYGHLKRALRGCVNLSKPIQEPGGGKEEKLWTSDVAKAWLQSL